MEPKPFTLAAFNTLGAAIIPDASGDSYVVEENGGRQRIHFDETVTHLKSTLFAAGAPPFLRLVDRVIATGVHGVSDVDESPESRAFEIAHDWMNGFGGQHKKEGVEAVRRCFDGMALVRVRATVAHDSYERLVEVKCSAPEHIGNDMGRRGLIPVPHTIEKPAEVGINIEAVVDAAKLDQAISEFCRFYLERRAQEMDAAGGDERKRKRLEDEFTPRLEMTLVGLDGSTFRKITTKVYYSIDGVLYDSTLTITPAANAVNEAPQMEQCSQTGKSFPSTCIEKCEISGKPVLKHLLVASQLSGRKALPEFSLLCSVSSERILRDEAEVSAVTGSLVTRSLLKSSALSGKRAEPAHFSKCEFTEVEVLNSELRVSDISGKRYRCDEQRTSAVSGITGHQSEFVVCQETGTFIAEREAERCDVTGNHVRPGVLAECAVTHKRVVPAQLSTCTATGQRVLNTLLVESSISGARILEDVALRSIAGKYCAPIEGEECVWTAKKFHPEDLRICNLTGLTIHLEFATRPPWQLRPLRELLDGLIRRIDQDQLIEVIATRASIELRGARCKLESSIISPGRRHLAVCVEMRTLLGLRLRHAGFVFEIESQSIVGRVAQGRRSATGWQS
jgi:hypothetical protein